MMYKKTFLTLTTIALLVLPACSGSSGSESPNDSTRITIDATLTSSNKGIQSLNTDDSVTYGWNLLEGEGTVDGAPVEVEVINVLDYLRGTGEFTGFATFLYGDGSMLTVKLIGEAAAATDTSNATFEGALTVIGGTGIYLDAAGTGTMTGERENTVGSPVALTFVIDVVAEGD